MSESFEEPRLALEFRPSVAEIGEVISFKHVFLHQDFVLRHISRSPLDHPGENDPSDTGIICPFCGYGHIVLNSIVPRLESVKAALVQGSLRHVGDCYYLSCSEVNDCGATYHGSIDWSHTD